MAQKWYVVIHNGEAAFEVEAAGPCAAIRRLAAELPREDARRLLMDAEDGAAYAVPLELVWDSVTVPGYLVTAIEYGPDHAGLEPDTPEYAEYAEAIHRLGALPAPIADWVRVDPTADAWAPVLMPH